MNRIAFLKSLLGKGLLVSVLPSELNNNKDNDYTNVLIYSTFIAGFRYYEGPKLIDKLTPGIPLDLIREPRNMHDPQAIAVHLGEVKLGFLPMSDNLILSNLIDNGVALYADILLVSPTKDPWQMCEIGIYLPYPKELLLSVGKSFD